MNERDGQAGGGPGDAGVVTLIPMTAEHLEIHLAERLTPEGMGEFQWFGFRDTSGVRARFAADGCLNPDGGILTVLVGGQWAGAVEWFPTAWGPVNTSRCWTIAIVIDPAFRGQGVGSQAQRLLVEYLFAHTPVDRIQAWTDHANVAEQRALLKVGFVEEGTLRKAQWRAGQWHDQKMFSVLRAEFI